MNELDLIIEKATFEPGISSNGWYQIYKYENDAEWLLTIDLEQFGNWNEF